MTGGEDSLRDAVLRAMLPHVARLGWTPAALAAGLRDAGQPVAAGASLFPRGLTGAVEQFAMLADREMVAAAGSLEELRTPARIRALVLARLAWLEPWRDAERRAVGLLALPWNAATGAAILARTADAMWLAAGDTATGFSRHSKRLTLAGVYAATLAFWLQGSSPGAVAAFLDRRLAGVARLGRRGPRAA